ncbi:Sodium-dependent phosphate transporter 2 [Hypsibius exemplaris]|uniref:Phosphate transporter n=1 Tax=Hypsibius exemplaris TaxID=2072580 RepID=A0A1W0XA95_HYPEX|nr:Sodium-dependent phosphate transporter 2 [Hypsibius exemplaris]
MPYSSLHPFLNSAAVTPMYEWDLLWIVVVGFIIAFFMAFTVGANDVANSFGPTVGSKVLSLRWACGLAVVCESLGAVLLGNRVSDTIWKEMVDISMYRGQEKVLLFGYISSLCGATIWLCIATILKIPVSGTHAIIAATVGFSLVKQGQQGIYWIRVIRIVASWFISPAFAGVVSGALFILLRRFVLEAEDPVTPALRAVPFFYGLTVFINVTSVFMHGTIIPGVVEKIPWWGVLFISSTMGLITGIAMQLFYVPYQRKRIAIHSTALRMEDMILARSQIRMHAPSITSEQMSMSIRAGMHEIHSSPELFAQPARIPGIPGSRKMRRTHSTNSRSKRRYKPEITSRNSLSAVERSEFLAAINVTETVIDELTPQAQVESITTEIEECAEVLLANSKEFRCSRVAKAQCPTKSTCLKKTQKETPPPPPPPPEVDANSGDAHSGGICVFCPYCPFRPKKAVPTPVPTPIRTSDAERGSDLTKVAKNEQRRRQSSRPGYSENNFGVSAIFSSLQIVTAIFTAFGHGGNDVSNAIGPLSGIWTIFTSEKFLDQARTPIWLLCFGALGMSCGLCILGRRVMETVGSGLSTVLPTSGFCIGLGTAFTVLISSEVGLPISTTHCIVGSVISVGWLRSQTEVNWRLLWKIILGWAITMPVAAGCSAAIMALLSLVA